MLLFVWPTRWKRRIAGPRDRGPALGRGLASILFIVLFYVGVLEVVYRVGQLARGRNMTPPWRYVDDSFLYEHSPFHAFGLRPNARIVWGTAGFYIKDTKYIINEFGCRGPALAPKESGKPRVIVIGGSVTFGTGVNYTDALPYALSELAPEWSVMNAGCSGYMSQHILNILQDRLLALEPDLVIVYTGRNDLHVNEAFAPDFRDDYGHVHGSRQAPRGVERWLNRHSFVFCRLSRFRLSAQNALGRVMQRRHDIDAFGPRGLDAFRRNYLDLISICRGRGIRLLFASEAPGYEPAGMPDGSPNPHLEHLAKEAPGCRPEVYTKGLEAYADALQGLGAPYVDTVRLLSRDPSLYTDSIHLNGKGAREAAKLLLPAAKRLIGR